MSQPCRGWRQHLLDVPRRRLRGVVRHIDGGAIRCWTAALLKQESDATYGDLRGKVVYNGRLKVQKALAAIPSLVD
jgi:hypothetical protein